MARLPLEACLAGAYNVMVALSSGEIVRIPIEEVAGKLHQVPLDSDLIRGREEPWDFLWGLTSMKRALGCMLAALFHA